MNTAKTWQTVSLKPEDTLETAAQLGQKCRGGEVFLLASDLGGGKTTFTKGLAKGLGSTDIVASPTFMVNRIYDCRDGIRIYHFDFYRLQEGGMVAHELQEVLDDPKAVVVVEWGDIVSDILPMEHVQITLERQKEDEDTRSITAAYSEKFNYLFEGLK